MQAGIDPTLLSLVALAISIFTTIIMIVLWIRQRALLKRYRLLLAGASSMDLEHLLIQQEDRIDTTEGNLDALIRRVDALAMNAQTHTQKVATVRFNAFPDTGSDLSFAIALLDARDNGVVLSSLYGRSESRTYAKPIVSGRSTYALSDEEKQAIEKAMGSQLKLDKQREKETSVVG